jgi:hypothetical protein
MKDPALPPRVFEHGAWYRIAVARGDKREWHKLSRIRDGLPAMWRAYAAFTVDAPTDTYLMPALIAEWQDAVLASRAKATKTAANYMLGRVSGAFAEFRPDQVEPPHCVEFLAQWADKPRSYNQYRALLAELMRYAMETGKRPAGTNPVRGVIRTKTEKPRQRCPTTSELRRIKIGCLYGDDGLHTRSGLTMAALIELAYLTGQDIGRLVVLRDGPGEDQNEPFLTRVGISFRRSKTGGRVLIEWTPRLRAAVAALKRIKAERMLRKTSAERRRLAHPYLMTRQDGSPMTYEAASNAWQRGLKRSGVAHCMFRDIRARAITDTDAHAGRLAANAMGAHTTEAQTAEYIRHKTARTIKATA